ncbi:MAG TPA: GNAT family N-acetyltransferase [Gammaproteobacteria bacterium]|nr:GNAT family N-acetyltransferase [Gammaproteobacteria bacterium]
MNDDPVFRPLGRDNWADFEKLFGERGGSGGCWCMLWRLSPADFEAGKGDCNRKAIRRLAESARSPGILAYVGGDAVGWCALAPREDYPGLARSRVLKPVDERPVWSVSCFYIDRAWRRRGISVALLDAAVEFARGQGAKIVEGYPVEPAKQNYPAVFAWTGTAQTFRRAGFEECLRRSPTRPIMRRSVES